MRLLAFLTLLFVLLAACGSPQATAPPAGATDPPKPSQTVTASPSASPSATATTTPTWTPTSTITPTPRPTATPQGYYAHDSARFSLTIPSDWEVVSEDAGGVVMFNARAGLAFIGVREVDPPYESVDTLIDELLDPQAGLFLSGAIVSRGETQLRDGTVAQTAVLEGLHQDGGDVGLHLVYGETTDNGYIFLVYGSPDALSARQNTLDRMFASISLRSATVYGLARRDALVMLGFAPRAESLDPARMTSSAASYVGQLFSGLVRINPDLQVVPDLADRWTISPDGTVYTFYLKPGLTFEDGKPLTAQDVLYSWERATEPELRSPTASTYLGDILGVDEKLKGEVEQIAGVQVVDDLTLEVVLDAPRPYFLAKLSYPTSFVVDEDDVEDSPEEWMFSPNASGPFRLREIHEDEALVLARNDAYHTPAKVANLVYLLYRYGPALHLYEAGDVDLVGLDYSEAEQVLAEDHPLHDQLISTPVMCTSFVQFNKDLPPMDDPLVRQALIQAIDRDRLIEQFTEGLSLPATTILPPAMPGHATPAALPSFDPEQAQTALESSFHAADLPPIVINTAGYGDEDDEFLNALLSMWRQNLGITVQVEYLDPENFTRLAREDHGHLVSSGWCADYPDPENFLDVLFHSQSDFNLAGFADDEIDTLLERARTEPDPVERLSQYQQIESALLAEGAVLPLMHSVSFTLVKPYVGGYVGTQLGVPLLHLLEILPIEKGE